MLTLRVHVRGCGGARVAVTDALGGAKGGGQWTALEGGIVTVALTNLIYVYYARACPRA